MRRAQAQGDKRRRSEQIFWYQRLKSKLEDIEEIMISDEQVLFLVLLLRRRIRREEAIKEKPLKKGLGEGNLS